MVFCRTGKRSARAVQLLRIVGFDHAQNLTGRINGWAERIQPELSNIREYFRLENKRPHADMDRIGSKPELTL